MSGIGKRLVGEVWLMQKEGGAHEKHEKGWKGIVPEIEGGRTWCFSKTMRKSCKKSKWVRDCGVQ